MENIDTPFSTRKAVHFCPGSSGGAEWNGVAYDPETNLVLTGETEWCTTVTLQTRADLRHQLPCLEELIVLRLSVGDEVRICVDLEVGNAIKTQQVVTPGPGRVLGR
jgi:hypothetical protein